MSKTHAYIYKCSFYDSGRCTESHTDMYFAKEKHTRWVHEKYCPKLGRVHVIRVPRGSEYHISAIENSVKEEKKNNKQ